MTSIYATKFVLEIRRRDAGEVESVLKGAVLPELAGRGYVEPVCVAAGKSLERLDRIEAERALSELAEKMLAVAQVRDRELKGDLAGLRSALIHGVTGHAHGMIHHHRKNKRPREYALLERELRRERNREIVPGVQLDLYASHSGGDLQPALTLLEEKLEKWLFLRPYSIEHMVFQRFLSDKGTHALQTFVAVPGDRRGKDPRDVKASLRALVEGLLERDGASGVMSLKSSGEGSRRGFRWYPSGIPQHRGDKSSPRDMTRGLPDIYELVTLWSSETERDKASERLERKLSDLTNDVEEGYGGFAGKFGESVIRPKAP
ncbi:hypothetical protein [Rubrobacter indicoceani]|uniref:hypothetical protein n=1 Tax=Rubrobacter indicoceani TaxID=2051957 RepID=UPI000E5B27E0|nr:hypothetical protein [Rubrobacter indicoceani]